MHTKPNGYLPKSGILLCNHLSKISKNKSVLDIGTGECGLLAIHAAKSGAFSVTGIDLDRKAVEWAKYNGKANKVNVNWLVSDTFPKGEERFDVIVSNPPQMPMRRVSAHDSGGSDGRRQIMKIILNAKKYLKDGGTLILLAFDFLSIDKKYGEQETILNTMRDSGYKTKILSRWERIVRRGGKTEASLAWIKKYYPLFEFKQKRTGELFHKVFVIEARVKTQ